ncbi:hypothetical protein MVES1_001375 [Malassezia vespertilionis]|uniref:uncharacterized protein n=1 Tax=Malassezia vespertilionis TaxID=2020962 RepID=UPI0024B0E12B|nr:uncharacterized protein MVES1_001375 [Malassezia vespertilionis]WFD06037.1 hypothetical protein MVES1_001375 [Malassezia vespertilionis]
MLYATYPRQLQPPPRKGEKKAYSGVMEGLAKIWKEEGIAGFMRGNGINCLRIAPYSAVQFTAYESMKHWLARPVFETAIDARGVATDHFAYELGAIPRLVAGAVAGIASVVSTYPLDLVRSRISIASASMYGEKGATPHRIPGIWEMTCKVYREEGRLRGLYRGCIPTSMGVAPYVAFNFFFYEQARGFFSSEDGTPPSAPMKLVCGAWAGAISQTLTYPLDVIRRRMQVAGMPDSQLGYKDKSGIDAIRNIVRRSGIKGLYFGLGPNLLKVAPSMGTSFLTFEMVRSLLSHLDANV